VFSFYAGFRPSEIVGDRGRRYRVLTPKAKRLNKYGVSIEKERARKKWNVISYPEKDEWDNDFNRWWTYYWQHTDGLWQWKRSPVRPGIRIDDVSIEDGTLFVTSQPLKGGKRDAPIELPLELPHMEIVERQLDRRRMEGSIIHEHTEDLGDLTGIDQTPNVKVWDLRREYVWEIFNELGIYPTRFRLTRATQLVRNREMSPLHIKNWMGWRRLETAYNYMEEGGAYQMETGDALVKLYKEKE
jgi:hypothetical protein